MGRILLGIVVLLVVAAIALVWRPAIAPVDASAHAAFDPKLVQRGAQLAALADCSGCHTREGGAPFAGGVPLKTPFGTLFGTNITPDPNTGLGKWPESAFLRAMRDGISRDGHHLYPAFPYDHFTRMSDADLGALYAFLMTRDPVHAEPPANQLKFPFNLRPLLAGWKLLYLDKTPYRPDASQSAEWNRGAYVADALAHCSACHSPRNRFGAERKTDYLGGGEAEGWYVPALNARSPSPIPWTADELRAYLRTGLVERHAIAGGPMQGVVHSLGQAPEAEVGAIAVYIHSVMGGPTPEREARAKASLERAQRGLVSASDDPPEGKAVYVGSCAGCHERGRRVSSNGALQLPVAIAAYDPDPSSLIRIILEGIVPAEGERGRWMPEFGSALTEAQVVALVTYLRKSAAGEPPWPDVAGAVKRARAP